MREDEAHTAGLTSSSQEASVAFKNMVTTEQPIRSSGRYMLRKIPELATIREAAFQEDEVSVTDDSNQAQNSVDDADYVFLESSPHSLATPRFIHGPIRLAKSDLYPDLKLGADDGLDWTAFQMAILGGAGDYFSGSEHNARQQEAEEIEALRDWWGEWHFDSSGSLVSHEDELPSPISTFSSDDRAEYLYSQIGKDNPYSAHHKWSNRRRHAGKQGRILDLKLSKQGDKLYNGGGIEKWSANGHPDSFMKRESLNSMPPSPMLDLQIVRSDNGDVDYVPMGYNMSHDAGDFLRWEAEHVYSDGTMYDGGIL
jgi:hypothetical protein